MTTNKKPTAEQQVAADAVTQVINADVTSPDLTSTEVIVAEVIGDAETATLTTPLFTTPLAENRGDADTVIAGPDAAWAAPGQHDAPGAAAEQRPIAGPRIRWAAIVWGLLFAAIAAGTLLTLLSPERRDAFAAWAVSLSPTTVTLYGLLAVGALVLVLGLVGLLRRAQRRLARS
ncbi:hypothetical protein [Microterricola pindariensis]|uniref:hypothetical protein n=1 Tax=Microterricola pindariensis TaxID=478010 RepID=UPI001E416592|nr:hypothetical protein [Microterricola pindariensis]